MTVTITREELEAEFPAETQELYTKLSQRADTTDALLSVDWGERIEGDVDIMDLLSGGAPPPSPYDVPTAEEYADNRLRNVVCVTAVLKAGRKMQQVSLPRLPQRVLAEERQECIDDYTKYHAEQARFNALTPEEQQAETNALLAQLSGDPGFMAIHIP